MTRNSPKSKRLFFLTFNSDFNLNCLEKYIEYRKRIGVMLLSVILHEKQAIHVYLYSKMFFLNTSVFFMITCLQTGNIEHLYGESNY